MHELKLRQIIDDQIRSLRNNPKGVRRIIDYQRLINSPFIIVITGIRRSGKSTLLNQLTEYYANFYYINFDDERLYDFKLEDFQTLMLIFKQKWQSKVIFLDEIQNIAGWERFVRRLYDDGFKIFITGSNSKLLSSELATHLTGRYIRVELYPFSFKEFLSFQNIDFKDLSTETQAKILKNFDDYLIAGGFPEYLKFRDIQYLQNLFNDIIFKDLVPRFGIKNFIALKTLAHYLITNFTSQINYNSLKNITSLKSTTSVKEYIELLKIGYLIFEIFKFDFSLKKQLSYIKKVYTIDNGLNSAISFKFSKDYGKLLENAVFLHLKRKFNKVWFYIEKEFEIDFVVPDSEPILYQVSYDISEQRVLERELKALEKASKIFKTDKLYLITYNTFDTVKLDNLKIEILPAWYFFIYDS